MFIKPNECIGCGVCKESCPVESLIERNGKYYINQTECIQCGTCQSVCPADAVVEDPVNM